MQLTRYLNQIRSMYLVVIKFNKRGTGKSPPKDVPLQHEAQSVMLFSFCF